MATIEDSYLYTESHEWVKIEGDIATIGITDFAQDQLGDIVYIEIPEVGVNVFQGQSFGSIESVKTVSELISPLTGNVVEVNEDLSSSPELVNKSPYENGWMIKIKIEDLKQIDLLLSPGDYDDLTIEG